MRNVILFLVLLNCAIAWSYTNEQLDSLEAVYDLEEIVITGTRTSKTLKDVPVQTLLITEKELSRANATNLQDLLQQELPGVEFSYAMNQQVNMNMAGFSGLSVLVLLDGERLAGETMDNVDFSRLPMNNVERIEIIRGAASALYGSNGSGGVINIITKKPKRAWTASVNGQIGSHNEMRSNVSVGLKHKCFTNMLDASFYRIGSYEVCLDQSDNCDYRRVSGNKVWNFSDRLQYAPIENLQLSGQIGYYFKERLYNPDTPDRYRGFNGRAKGIWKISTVDNVEIGYIYDQYDKSDFIKDYGLEIRDYRNVQHTFKMLYNHAFRNGSIMTCGGDIMRDWLSSYQFEDDTYHRQYTADVFAQYDWALSERLEIVGALRWDWFSDRAVNCITPKVNVRYHLGEWTIRGGYAGGFRAPSLKEKYMLFNMADIFDIHGNPNLKSEKSHNVNISAEYGWRNYYFFMTGSYSKIKNKIGTSGILYDKDNTPYIDYINVANMQVFSIDASVKAHWTNGLSAQISYNFTHEETAGGGLNQYCPVRPHSLNARINWNKDFKAGFETDISLYGRFLSRVGYESMYMYPPFESRKITNPAYTLWKFQLSQQIFNFCRVIFTIDNILNYRPKVYSFNAPVTTGATFQLGINIEIDKIWKE